MQSNNREEHYGGVETDSLVLEVDDLDDEWSEAGFPRSHSSWRRHFRATTTRRVFLGALALTTLCLGIRQIASRYNKDAGSSVESDDDDVFHPLSPQQELSSLLPTLSPTSSSGSANSTTTSTLTTMSPTTASSPQNPSSTTISTQTTETVMRPFSLLDPVQDLDLLPIDRPFDSRPPQVLQRLQERHQALPTNAWYQNVLMLSDDEEQKPTSIHRAYVMPHVVDAAGPTAGLRVLPGRLQVGASTTEFIVNENFGLTLGAMGAPEKKSSDEIVHRRYVVDDATKLAVTLEWGDGLMKAPIVRGMPYGTMIYDKRKLEDGSLLLPTISGDLSFDLVRVDNQDITQQPKNDEESIWVEHEIELVAPESDFTWLIFVSERVEIRKNSLSSLQIMSWQAATTNADLLVVRVVVSNTCSSSSNPAFCQTEHVNYAGRKSQYADLLRKHAHVYPGSRSFFSFELAKDMKQTKLLFDWDAQNTGNYHPLATGDEEILAFALPHHSDMQFAVGSPTEDQFCWDSLLGWSCTVKGSKWQLTDALPDVSFRAPRRPAPWVMNDLASSLVVDIQYRLPDNYRRGAGDTYFSGKMLAKMARILVIAEEVQEICSSPDASFADVCSLSSLPDDQNIQAAVNAIKESLDIWLSQSSEAPFVYDSSWGGVPNCGCYFGENGCANKYPNCPAFSDGGLNFGNGFFNDMHFHYGYFIYAAAVVAKFDPAWATSNYEMILLLVRNIANPSRNDKFFPFLRHVDPFRGHSFASGITLPVFRNGRNQESSSEAIASYEAVALFGKIMASIFDQQGAEQEKKSADAVEAVGRTILAMELRSARKYWHVKHEEGDGVFEQYQHGVVGILWQTMFQFQTFFGTEPFFVYGIQLLPLTPASEQRDDLEWIRVMYGDFAASCVTDCASSGWSIQQLAVLATGGHADTAFEQAMALPSSVFETSGGNGHSLSNTLWYISTRPPVEDPVVLTSVSVIPPTVSTPATVPLVITCGRPDTCTAQVLDNKAGEYSCGDRIRWLIASLNFSEVDACNQVAGVEFPNECNGC